MKLAKFHGITWARRLYNAKKRGRFNSTDKILAGLWTRCAVGEVSAIPQNRAFVPVILNERSRPEDLELEMLGASFGSDVDGGHIKDAMVTFKAIKDRIKKLRQLKRLRGWA